MITQPVSVGLNLFHACPYSSIARAKRYPISLVLKLHMVTTLSMEMVMYLYWVVRETRGVDA